MFILAGLMLNCCVLSVLYRPFYLTEEIDIELSKDDECDKPIETGHPEKPSKISMHTEILQSSPLLSNGDHSSNTKPVERHKPLSPSTPRSFAEIRKEQMNILKLKEENDTVSQRSITKVMLSQSIFGSHASFDYIIEKRHRSKSSQINLNIPDNVENDTSINDQRKRFKVPFIELMFPKELITNMNFVIMMIATFLVGVPSFIPFSMLPDYAISAGTTQSNSAWLLSAMGIGGKLL